jgi:hypothetical protein
MSFKLTGVSVSADGSITNGVKEDVGLIDGVIDAAAAISKVASKNETTYYSESQMGMTAAVNAGFGFLLGDWFGNSRGRSGRGPLIFLGKV